MLNDNINVEAFYVLAPCGAAVMGAIGGNGSRSGRMADFPLSS